MACVVRRVVNDFQMREADKTYDDDAEARRHGGLNQTGCFGRNRRGWGD